MTDKRDTSLNLSESAYLTQLKERTTRLDPLTKRVLENSNKKKVDKKKDKK